MSQVHKKEHLILMECLHKIALEEAREHSLSSRRIFVLICITPKWNGCDEQYP